MFVGDEQGNREVFQATLAELRRRAPSDDQVQALTQMPPPGGESLKPGAKRRAAPKRPTDPSVAAVLNSSIPPHPSQAPYGSHGPNPDRASAPGRPSRTHAAPARVPPRVPPRVPTTPKSSSERREPSDLGLDRRPLHGSCLGQAQIAEVGAFARPVLGLGDVQPECWMTIHLGAPYPRGTQRSR